MPKLVVYWIHKNRIQQNLNVTIKTPNPVDLDDKFT